MWTSCHLNYKYVDFNLYNNELFFDITMKKKSIYLNFMKLWTSRAPVDMKNVQWCTNYPKQAPKHTEKN